MQETWKDIVGYEGLYQVSNLGNVKSLDRIGFNNRKLKSTTLRGCRDKDGYYRVNLYGLDHKKKYKPIHRLVYEAFNGVIPEDLVVNHKDEIKTNNRLTNLEIITPRENSIYGTAIQRSKAKQINDPKKSKPVLQIDKNTGEVIKEYPSTKEVERQLGIARGHITECAKGKAKSAGGYIWKYK